MKSTKNTHLPFRNNQTCMVQQVSHDDKDDGDDENHDTDETDIEGCDDWHLIHNVGMQMVTYNVSSTTSKHYMHVSKTLYCVRWCSYKCCVFSLQHVSSLRSLHTQNFCPPSKANDPFDQSTPGFPSFFRRVIEQVFWILFFQLDKKYDVYTIFVKFRKYVLNFQLQKFKIQHRFHLWIILYTSYFMRPPAHLNDL